jgi:hypothetical protein
VLAVVATVVLTLFLAASAAAQEPPVFIDPDSPAGVEYDVPLAKARREAAGGSTGQGPTGARSAGSQPLFGVGIKKQGGGGSGVATGSDGAEPQSQDAGSGAGGDRRGAEGGGGSGGRGSDGGGSSGEGTNGGSSIPPGERGTAAVQAAAGGGSESLLIAGIAAGVLAIGLVLGFGLRRLLRET